MSQSVLKQTLGNTMDNLAANPSTAKVVFRADTWLEDGVRCAARVREFDLMNTDEPPDLGGADSAMNPVELILVSLGTCQEVMYAAFAAVMDIPLDEVKVTVKGYLDLRGLFAMGDGIPAGYQRVVFETQLTSSADEAALKKLVQMVEAHCPVLDTLSRPIEVSGKVRINGKETQIAAASAAG